MHNITHCALETHSTLQTIQCSSFSKNAESNYRTVASFNTVTPVTQ